MMLTVVSMLFIPTAIDTSEYRAVTAAWDARVASDSMARSSAGRYAQVFGFFGRFLESSGHTHLLGVDTATCRAFIYAGRSGNNPASATSRLRLTVVRGAFETLKGHGLIAVNPTDGLAVWHPKSVRSLAPLTPAEAMRLRHAGRVNPRDSLRPATVELGLLGASHELIGRVTEDHVDLAKERVKVVQAWHALDPWAVNVMRLRLAACRRNADRARRGWDPAQEAIALTRPASSYPATSIGPTIATNLARAMDAAGLTRDGLRPSSLREYAANRAYAQTSRIEDVAELLGLSSLDSATRFIDPAWQATYGEQVRDSERG